MVINSSGSRCVDPQRQREGGVLAIEHECSTKNGARLELADLHSHAEPGPSAPSAADPVTPTWTLYTVCIGPCTAASDPLHGVRRTLRPPDPLHSAGWTL